VPLPAAAVSLTRSLPQGRTSSVNLAPHHYYQKSNLSRLDLLRNFPEASEKDLFSGPAQLKPISIYNLYFSEYL
jgi:hypothetical protein